MSDIAKALDRRADCALLLPALSCTFFHCTLSDPLKYFGFELGALTKVELQADRYIVNGKHEAEDMAKVLDGFIEKYVLCGVRPRSSLAANPMSPFGFVLSPLLLF